MNKIGTTLRDFWTAPIRVERMALFRIAVGALVAIDTWSTILPHAVLYLGRDGLYPARLHEVLQFGWKWSLLPADASPTQVHLVVLGLIVAATCVAFGLATRVASIAMWILLVSVHQRSPFIMNGGDFLLQVAALFLVFMPAGLAWSLDATIRRRRGLPIDPWVLPWPYRLAQIQLAVMYLFTGLSKLPPPGYPGVGKWISGEAIAGAIGTATMGRFEFLTRIPWWVYAPFTWLTLVWELTFPILVAFRRTRYLTLSFGVLLHLGIFATIEVGAFSFATLCYYVLFLPAEWFGPEEEPPITRGDHDA